jgi:hypothetical protein
MLEKGLDLKYKLYVIQLIKAVSFLSMMQLKLKVKKIKNIDIQLGLTTCRVYQNALVESNVQSYFDCLRKLHTLDMTESDN